MGLMTFKGGVHPYDGKDLSKDKLIRELLRSEERRVGKECKA